MTLRLVFISHGHCEHHHSYGNTTSTIDPCQTDVTERGYFSNAPTQKLTTMEKTLSLSLPINISVTEVPPPPGGRHHLVARPTHLPLLATKPLECGW